MTYMLESCTDSSAATAAEFLQRGILFLCSGVATSEGETAERRWWHSGGKAKIGVITAKMGTIRCHQASRDLWGAAKLPSIPGAPITHATPLFLRKKSWEFYAGRCRYIILQNTSSGNDLCAIKHSTGRDEVRWFRSRLTCSPIVTNQRASAKHSSTHTIM